jgi:hypothetical protein
MPHKSDMPMLDVLDRKIGKPKQTKDNVPSAFQSGMGGGEPGGENLQSKVLGAFAAGAAAPAVGAAGSALLKGSLRPALGLATAYGTGAAVHKIATYLGAPEWVAESVATIAAAEAGGAVSLTPEMRAKIKVSGVKGLIKDLINGTGAPPKPSAVEAFWADTHPGEPLPAPGKAFEDARAELTEYRRQAALKLREAAKSPKSPKVPKQEGAAPAPEGTAPADAPNGSNYGFTHPKESLTDVRKQLFSNTQQMKIPNDQVRVRFTQLHGHGISQATYDEVQEFNEYIAKNGKLPLPPPKETEK